MQELRLKNFNQTLEDGLTLNIPQECLQLSISNPTRTAIKETLKAHRLYKYYEYIPAIVDIFNNITTSPMTEKAKQIMRDEYSKYIQTHNKSIPPRNFIHCLASNPHLPFTFEQREFIVRRFPYHKKYKSYNTLSKM